MQKSILEKIVLVVFLGSCLACGTAEFKTNVSKTKDFKSTDSGSEQVEAKKDSSQDLGVEPASMGSKAKSTNNLPGRAGVLEETEIDARLLECAEDWKGVASFTDEQLLSPRVITLADRIQVWSETGDYVTTEKPQLVLVDLKSRISSGSKLQLHNPNGYYCVDNQMRISSSLTIELACGAQLSIVKSRGGISVGTKVEKLACDQ